MRTLLTLWAAVAFAALGWAGRQTSTPVPPKAPAKNAATAAAAKKPAATTTARKPVSATAATRKKTPAAPVRTTWRNRQATPTTDRYKQIQNALVARGYLTSEDATGSWGPASADALKKFQAEQALETTGKIDSLSLIALGLGPKHDSTMPLVADGNAPLPEGRN